MAENDDDNIYGGRSRKAVAARLTLTREVLGLRQGEFGKRAGIKASMYNHVEKGSHTLSVKNALALSDCYRLSLDWIYKGDPSAMEYQFAEALQKAYNARKRVV